MKKLEDIFEQRLMDHSTGKSISICSQETIFYKRSYPLPELTLTPLLLQTWTNETHTL